MHLHARVSSGVEWNINDVPGSQHRGLSGGGGLTSRLALCRVGGKVFSRMDEKHTHEEWLRFLKQIHRESPRDLTLHIILDNYATHKKQEVKD